MRRRRHFVLTFCLLAPALTLCVLEVLTRLFIIYFANAAVAVDFNDMTASSSASWSRFSPPSNFVMGTCRRRGSWSVAGHRDIDRQHRAFSSNGEAAARRTAARRRSSKCEQCHVYSRRRRLNTHTHTHPFNGRLSRTTRVSRHQKGKTNLDFTEARDGEWQWHQLGHMQVCTSLQTDNHTSKCQHRTTQFFCRPDALPAAQPKASMHRRQKGRTQTC